MQRGPPDDVVACKTGKAIRTVAHMVAGTGHTKNDKTAILS